MTKVLARLDSRHRNKIVLESSFEHREAIQQLLARKWSVADKVWTMPLSWVSCIQLRNTFGPDLEIASDLAEWASEYKKTVVEPSGILRELINLSPEDGPDHTKLNDSTSETAGLEKELSLFPHQAVGAAFMSTHRGCGIFDETGTGKSAQTITALRAAHRAGNQDIFPALVVVPNSIKVTWQREFARWWPGLTVNIVEGGLAQRRKALETPAHVYIINYEQMHRHSRLARYGSMELKRCTACGGLDEKIDNTKCEVHERELNQIHFNTVIADESHRLLHPSKQTRAVWAVSDRASRRYALTGTPVQNDLNDLWFILRFISPNDFPSKTRFIDRYADTAYTQWGIIEIIGIKKERELEFRTVTELMVRRMLKEIVLPFLPPLIRERRYIPLTAPQKKAYREMKKDASVVLARGEETDTISADSPLVVATRLLQFASSYGEITTAEVPVKTSIGDSKTTLDDYLNSDDESVYKGDDTGATVTVENLKLALPSNKITAFLNDIESGDFGDSSIVVFAQSRQLIELLSGEMTRKGYEHGLITGSQSTEERQQHIDNFQDRKIKYILVTIQAGGVGLTLTAADINVFIQRSYSSTAMKQALSRSHRIGAEIHESVTIIDYISEKTIEEKQLDALESKDGRIEEILKDKELLKKFIEEDD
ncbi:putative DNA helicase [Gordonia phage GMA2]|uniref:Putative DNA helicase n=1 Tax=Gordonia phage GMA2 TaxID=1647283 RepID=A0A0K0N784_9CAUD|nr:putative DNA helicase [Gordonia phage GMA2]AKJ72602.1 putative DNA helicase [Gordonia phage GMA2]